MVYSAHGRNFVQGCASQAPPERGIDCRNPQLNGSAAFPGQAGYLLGGPGSIDVSQSDYLGFTGTSRSFDALYAIALNAEGDLFKLGSSDRPVSPASRYSR